MVAKLSKFWAKMDIPSGSAIGFISLNVVAMLWVDVIRQGITMADVAMVGAIFAAKTTHGIMTAEKQ